MKRWEIWNRYTGGRLVIEAEDKKFIIPQLKQWFPDISSDTWDIFEILDNVIYVNFDSSQKRGRVA